MNRISGLAPVFDANSEILILGCFPSVMSRDEGFYYANPRNRFWRVVAAVFGEDTPRTIEEKKAFLRKHRIALWDVVESCEIEGSSDQKVHNPAANDLTPVLRAANIRRIFVNGRKAQELFAKLIAPRIGRQAEYLPSTSPANAAMKLDQLIQAWSGTINAAQPAEGKT